MVDIAVFAEGPTEWLAVRTLWKRGILKEANLLGGQESRAGNWVKKVEQLIVNEHEGILLDPPCTKILLLYDQEQKFKPDDISQEITNRAQKAGLSFTYIPIQPYNNVFLMEGQELAISLHVAEKPGPGGNRDFDGYIVELLECAGPKIITNLLSDKDILTVSSLRNKVQFLPEKERTIYLLGREVFPGLMNERGWNVQRSKTLLYSFITATQINESHVLFSKDVIEKAPVEKLRQVFAPLIAAWDTLVAMAVMDDLRW